MYNESNVDSRLRIPVRGRVIGFTTSFFIEYLNGKLTRSVPLYYREGGGRGNENLGVGFCLEVDGFLTFDKDSYVKIEEVGEFERFDASATSFRDNMLPADPYQPTLATAEGVYNPQTGNYLQAKLGYYSKPYNSGNYELFIFNLPAPKTPEEITDYLTSLGIVYGAPWLGKKGYSPLVPV